MLRNKDTQLITACLLCACVSRHNGIPYHWLLLWFHLCLVSILCSALSLQHAKDIRQKSYFTPVVINAASLLISLFTTPNADVVTFANAYYGEGTGPVLISEILQCTGTEAQLISCPRSLVSQACTHQMDSGVRCQGLFVLDHS